MKRLAFLVLIFIMFTALPALAVDLTFSWLPAEDGDRVTGYKIYYGSSSGNYTKSVDVGLPKTEMDGRLYGVVPGISNGALLYFAATAYNEDAESDYSVEVVNREAWNKPGKPNGFRKEK